jgi:hypothetical protein
VLRFEKLVDNPRQALANSSAPLASVEEKAMDQARESHLPRTTQLVCLLAVLLLIPTLAAAEIHITLTNAFIDKYKDRVTIDATYTVDRAHKRPNPPSQDGDLHPSQDGDLHVAGRAPEIGLASVAEIMNAASVPTAVTAAQDAEGGSPIPVSGVWRIWTEHGGDQDHVQGRPLSPADTTNPDHVFQIHPITMIKGEAVLSTLVPIDGYTAKDAHDAFVRYENMRSTITVSNTKKTTTIATTMAGYNYVRFVLELLDSPGLLPVSLDRWGCEF